MAIVQKSQRDASQLLNVKQPVQAPKAGGPAPSRDKIAARAYEIWKASGSTPGHDQEHWLQAERELRAGQPH